MKKHFKPLMALLFGVAMMFNLQTQAQVTIGADAAQIFDGWSDAPFLLKFELGDGNSAFRLALGGERGSNTNPYQLYDHDLIVNLDDATDIASLDAVNSYSEFMIRPGLELRKPVGTKSVFYYGVDVGFSMYKSESENRSFSQSKTGSDPSEYTITYIQKGMYSQNNLNITPGVFLGASRDLGHGFSIFGEVSIIYNMRKRTQEGWTYDRWDWDYGDEQFNKRDVDNYEPRVYPWQSDMDWNPRLRAYIAYTIGGGEE